MKKKIKKFKPRNIMALELADPKYRMKIVKSKKIYKRNKNDNNHYEDKLIFCI